MTSASQEKACKPLGELARLCGAELRGATGQEPISGVAPLDTATPADVAFYAQVRYRSRLASCRAGAIVANPSDANLPELAGRALLLASSPAAAFARIAQALHPAPAVQAGIDPTARIEPGAEVHPTARVEAFAFVGSGAVIGAGVTLGPGACVGPGARVGDGSILHERAVVRERCQVGKRCVLHPGVVIGADGFGFAFDPEGDGQGPLHRKMPQEGIARLEDDVEIGANSCVDRATFGETVVGRGTKIDNLVQIGHNVVLGPLCLLAAQTGIAGSTTVGTGVAMGGQVGVIGHIHIGDLARLGAGSGVGQDVPAGATMSGAPVMEHKLWLRAVTAFPRLPQLLRDVRELRRRLALPHHAEDSNNPDR